MFELRPYNHGNSSMYDPFKAFEDFGRYFFGTDPFESTGLMSGFGADVTDEGDHYLIKADMPGFEKSDIDVSLENDVMTIKAERHSEREDKDKRKKYIRCERSYGSYVRQFDVSGVDADNIKLSYENGVLNITMPKKTELDKSKRKLEIE